MNQCKICNGIKGVHGSVLPGCTCAQSYTPNQQNKEWEWKQPVMTLRDYFAAKASEEDVQKHIWKGHTEDYVTTDGYGKKSIMQRPAMRTREEARYRYADAMLEAREEKP